MAEDYVARQGLTFTVPEFTDPPDMAQAFRDFADSLPLYNPPTP